MKSPVKGLDVAVRITSVATLPNCSRAAIIKSSENKKMSNAAIMSAELRAYIFQREGCEPEGV
jgi:hypothetical protein